MKTEESQSVPVLAGGEGDSPMQLTGIKLQWH
jgi:hypothetical protein